MKKILIVIVITFMLSGCITKQRCIDRYPQQATEKIVIKTETIYRDTTIYVTLPAEVIHDTHYVYIDKGGLVQSDVSELKTRFAYSTAYVKDSKLFHNLEQIEDSIAAIIEKATKTEIQVIEKTNTIEVEKRLSWWQLTQIYAGRLLFTTTLALILVIIARAVFFR